MHPMVSSKSVTPGSSPAAVGTVPAGENYLVPGDYMLRASCRFGTARGGQQGAAELLLSKLLQPLSISI